jgi:hypothetical protein
MGINTQRNSSGMTQQIIDGYTDNGSHGAKGITTAEPIYPLEKAIREIAKMSSVIAKEEIERLEELVKTYEKQIAEIKLGRL